MSLMIELSAEQEAILGAAARRKGIAPAELVQEMLAEKLPELNGADEPAATSRERDPQLRDYVRSVRGKYADLGVTTDDLHRERLTDRERHER